jgi:hypothetical protein
MSKNIYDLRHIGKDYCNTEGSDHYKQGVVEPLDLVYSLGLLPGFALGSIIKYAARFINTQNPNDLKKIADYAHILCGAKLQQGEDK